MNFLVIGFQFVKVLKILLKVLLLKIITFSYLLLSIQKHTLILFFLQMYDYKFQKF